jgi:hypothetical protein
MLPAISTLPVFKNVDSNFMQTKRRSKSAKPHPFKTSYFSATKIFSPTRSTTPAKTPSTYLNKLPTIREYNHVRSSSHEFERIIHHRSQRSESRNTEIVKEIESVSNYAKKLTSSAHKHFSKTVTAGPNLKPHSVKKLVRKEDGLFKTQLTDDKYFNKSLTPSLSASKRIHYIKRVPTHRELTPIHLDRNKKYSPFADRIKSTGRHRSQKVRRYKSQKELTLTHEYLSELERISDIKSMPDNLKKTYLSNILLYKCHINVNYT